MDPNTQSSTRGQYETPVQSSAEQEQSRQLSSQSDEIPSSVGGYDVLNCLGRGSFGTVWLARERKTGRQVAIKFFTNRRSLDWSLLTREVEKLAVLDASRDVVRLLDVGVDQNPPYFVMEYLPHRSVATLLEVGPLPIPQSIEITRSVARALVHAHSAGILHCDIKPGNVLLDRANEARLGDFGQSRLATDVGSALGTFYYMAPEQAARDAVPDVRWDVYALGALLYHMLVGAPPYQSEEADALLESATTLDERLRTYRNLINESPLPSDHRSVPGVDATLVELVDRCLQPDPIERIPNPQVILDTLDRRELNRARRPLIWLGFLGPILLLLSLLWIASRVMQQAVTQAESHLSARALSSDTATARLLASSIQRELLDRQTDLERLAVQLAASGPEEDGLAFRDDLIPFLDRWHQEMAAQLKRQNRTPDESFFLTNREGIQIYRAPWTESIGHTFSYRDYFHGLGRELNPLEVVKDIQPRSRPGISLAFRSSNTNRLMVAVAVPVYSHDESEVIGILARTVHLSNLLQQWEERIGIPREVSEAEISDRLLSLIDMREDPPLILDHHWLQEERAKQIGTEAELKQLLRLNPAEEQQLRRALRAGSGIENYHDPLADLDSDYQGSWLAAVAEVPEVNWIAIVQERRTEAVKPMADLYWIFLRGGLALVFVFAAMLILLWWLIQRAAETP